MKLKDVNLNIPHYLIIIGENKQIQYKNNLNTVLNNLKKLIK